MEKRERRIAGRVKRCIVAGSSLMRADIRRILQIRGHSILLNLNLSSVTAVMISQSSNLSMSGRSKY